METLSLTLNFPDSSASLCSSFGRALATAFSSPLQPCLVSLSLSSPNPLSLFPALSLSLSLQASLFLSWSKARPTAEHLSTVAKRQHTLARDTQRVPITLGLTWRPLNYSGGDKCMRVMEPQTHNGGSPSSEKFNGGSSSQQVKSHLYTFLYKNENFASGSKPNKALLCDNDPEFILMAKNAF